MLNGPCSFISGGTGNLPVLSGNLPDGMPPLDLETATDSAVRGAHAPSRVMFGAPAEHHPFPGTATVPVAPVGVPPTGHRPHHTLKNRIPSFRQSETNRIKLKLSDTKPR